MAKNASKQSARQFNGLAIVCSLLRAVDPQFRKKLLDKISESQPLLALLAEQTSFLYNDLERLDDTSLQHLIRHLPQQELLLAWKLTNKNLRARLLTNMSKAAREDFLHRASNAAKVHRSVVLKQQLKIAGYAHRLLQTGKIKMGTRYHTHQQKQVAS